MLALDGSVWVAQNNLAMVILKLHADEAGGPASSAVKAAAKEAVSLAALAVRAHPRLATVHDTLAQAQHVAGDDKAAADAVRAAIRLEPESAKWRVRLAYYLLESGDTIGAAAALHEIDKRRLDTRALPAQVEQQLKYVRDGTSRVKPASAGL